MARFLTDEWFADLRAAASTEEVGKAAAGVELRLAQVVTGGPDGDRRYTVAVAGGTVDVRPGNGHPADATFTEDYETAAAIHRGDLSPQEAFMTGRIRVSGNIAALIAGQDALARLAPALAGVRPSTTY